MRTFPSFVVVLAVVATITMGGALQGQTSAPPGSAVNFKVVVTNPDATPAAQPEAQSTDYVLRFQLIEAGNIKGSDPAVSAVDSVLRDLFKFPGYRLISQAAVSISTQPSGKGTTFGMSKTVLSGPLDSYLLDVTVTTDSASRLAPRLSVSLRSQPRDPAISQKSPLPAPRPMELLSTTVTIAIGRTVVLGSTQPGGPGEALILVVRPEIRK